MIIFVSLVIGAVLGGRLAEADANPCPKGFVYANNCGDHFCYIKVAVPEKQRALAVQDNFCKTVDKNAFPASVHCGEENRFIVKTFGRVGIGFYVHNSLPITLANFKNADGTPRDYEFWDRFFEVGKLQPDNGNKYERIVMTQAKSYGNRLSRTRKGWHDENPKQMTSLLCKVKIPAENAPKAVQKAKVVNTCPSSWDYGDFCGLKSCYKILDVDPKDREIALPKNLCNRTNPTAIVASIYCEEEDEWITRYGNGFTIGLTIRKGDILPHTWNFHHFHFLQGSRKGYEGWDTNPDLKRPQPDNEEGKTGMERVVMHTRLDNDKTLPQSKRPKQYQRGWNDYQPKYITRLLCKMPAPGLPTAASEKPPKKCRPKRLQ